MENSIFAKIVRGETDTKILYEVYIVLIILIKTHLHYIK